MRQMIKYLGIDPGRSKTGLAVVDANGAILSLHIAQTANISDELCSFAQQEKFAAIVMGNGTNSKAIAEVVARVYPDVALYTVGEAYSTEEARSLYWQVNPPKGWHRLLPLGLQVPPEPLDAYAAVVQVRRWLARNSA